MNDRQRALIKLIAKVEAEESLNSRECSSIWPTGYAHAINASHGSLDAANSLHEAVLSGTLWVNRFGGVVTILHCGEEHTGVSDNPARAWLIAILMALIADIQNMTTNNTADTQ
jgi:hypothetical protein